MNSVFPSIVNNSYSHFYVIIFLNIILNYNASAYVSHKHHTYAGQQSTNAKPVNYDDFSEWDNWVPRASRPFPMPTTTTTRKPTTTLKTTVTITSTTTAIPTVPNIVFSNAPYDFTLDLMTLSLSHVVFCLVTAVIIFVLITFVIYCCASMSIENDRSKVSAQSLTTLQIPKHNSEAEGQHNPLMDNV